MDPPLNDAERQALIEAFGPSPSVHQPFILSPHELCSELMTACEHLRNCFTPESRYMSQPGPLQDLYMAYWHARRALQEHRLQVAFISEPDSAARARQWKSTIDLRAQDSSHGVLVEVNITAKQARIHYLKQIPIYQATSKPPLQSGFGYHYRT